MLDEPDSSTSSPCNELNECLTLDFTPKEKINQWVQLMNVNEFVASPRSKHTMVQFDETSIYVFGGDNARDMLNDLIRYDVKDESWGRAWTTGTPPAPRYHHSASIYGKSMLIFGGYTGDIHSNSNLTNRNDLFEYKFATGQWSEIKYEGRAQPVPRSAHGAAVYDNKLWIFAGYDGNVRLNDLWYFPLNGEKKNWTLVEQKGDCPPTCCNFPVAVVNDCMYVFSGQSGAKMTNDLFMFHFPSKTWTRISATEHILRGGPAPPSRRYGHTMVAYDNHLYVFGGSASTEHTLPNELHCFDLEARIWSKVEPTLDSRLPSGRLFHSAVVIDDSMYIFGGTNSANTRSAELFKFRFSKYPLCTLKQDFGRLLRQQLVTDLTFVLHQSKSISTSDGSPIRLNAHIAFAAARSPYFRKEISLAKATKKKDLKVDCRKKSTDKVTSNQPDKLEIHLSNIDCCAFKIVLNYMYTDRIDPPNADIHPLSNEMVLLIMNVYTLAVLFEMHRLETLCIQYLKAAININNVLVAIQNANSLKLEAIKETCVRFIVRENNFTDIVMSKEFETLSKELIIEIIRSKQVPINKSNETMTIEPSLRDRSLQQDMEIFLRKVGKEFADIHLKLNDDAIIPSHRAILAARCSYFEAMFSRFTSFESFTPNRSQIVNIKIGEIMPSLQSFQTLLKYIYYGEVDMPPEDSLYLFSAPAYYGFTNNRFQTFCKHNLETGVNTNNVLQILEASERINATEMKKHALNLIVSDLGEVTKQDFLNHLSRELMLAILRAYGNGQS